jgi:TonB family protein
MLRLALWIVVVLLALSPAIAQEPNATAQADLPGVERYVPTTSSKHTKQSDTPPACPASFDDSPDTNGIFKLGKETGVTPPKATHTVVPNFSKEGRQAIKGKKVDITVLQSVIRLVVDKDGNPAQLCLAEPAGHGLDAEAGKAVRQYRFDPATKDGEPVAVRINIAINFRYF